MSATEPTPAPVSDATSDRFSLIELDIPAPQIPAWIKTLLTAIAAILPSALGADAAFEALRALCAPIPQMPEWATATDTEKATVRAAKDAKLAEINVLHTLRPGDRQALPVVHDVPSAPHVAASVSTSTPRAVIGGWRKVHGEWCALMPATANTRAPRVGDVVCVERRNGHRENKLVTALVQSTAEGVIVAVESTTEPVSYFAGTSFPANHAPDGTPVVHTAQRFDGAQVAIGPVNSELAADDLGLAQSLAAAQGESAANASAQASGSMADGTMRGVGFSTAAGYVQALANGVKLATAESYKSTLRGQYGYTSAQIDALTVTIIPEATLPVGTGITHTPTGPSIFDRPRTERVFKVGESKSKADVRALISERDFIAGAVAAGSMMQASWTGSGQSTCEAFNETLAPLGLEDLAPSPPSAVRHAGDAVAALRGRDYDTTRLPSNDLPDGINARWLVGRKLTGKAISAGDAYGTALLVVSLHDDETISFDGDATLAATVRATYQTSTAKETLRSNTLTPWLSGLLYKQFRAVKRGHVWYVPAGCAEQARKLIEAIAPLWGDHELMPVTTGKDLMRSLTRGLSDEVSALVAELAKRTIDAQDRAEEKARKEAADRKLTGTHGEVNMVEIARKRATVSGTVANSIMARLATVAARAEGYTAALGEESTKAVKAEIATLRATLEPLADDASLRAAMLELS